VTLMRRRHIVRACMARIVLVLLPMMCLAAPYDDSTRVTNGLAALMQAMAAVKEYVAGGDLSSIHNEDSSFSAALSVLKTETTLDSRAKQQELVETIATFGRQVGDIHEAADAFNAKETKARLEKLIATDTHLRAFYSQAILAQARRLADVYACPMHRDVVGKRTEVCRKCGMPLDQPVRVQLMIFGATPPHTVAATIRTDARPEPGKSVKATLRLVNLLNGDPVSITDLRIVHTERIHLLIIEPSLTDYHHVHPVPTSVPGAYAFSFTPATAGPYRAWADVRTTYDGFQEYAVADMASPAKAPPVQDRRQTLKAQVDGLQYTLLLESPTVIVNQPARAKLRVTDASGRGFTRLEPIMGTFAHLAAFNEDWKTVLHLHPTSARPLVARDRGGPDLDFQIYATQPGFYRLFAQVQIKGTQKSVPFGLTVAPAARSTPTSQ
jgi:hypothetical protein